jgi:hypothetical protein
LYIVPLIDAQEISMGRRRRRRLYIPFNKNKIKNNLFIIMY